MKYSTIAKLAKWIKANKAYYYDYSQIGIRVQDDLHGLTVGSKVLHVSHVWDDGSDTGIELNGVCAVDVELAHQLGMHGGYDGDYAIVLGSDSASGGEDIAESIMTGAVVLDIIHADDVNILIAE